jgi:hypothetical protein
VFIAALKDSTKHSLIVYDIKMVRYEDIRGGGRCHNYFPERCALYHDAGEKSRNVCLIEMQRM